MSPVMSSPEDGVGIDKSDLKSIKKTTELPPPPKKPLSPYMRFSKGVGGIHIHTFENLCILKKFDKLYIIGFNDSDYAACIPWSCVELFIHFQLTIEVEFISM